MSQIEMKTPSGGSATIKPLDRATNEEYGLPVEGGVLLTKEEMEQISHPEVTGNVTLNGTTNNTVSMTDIVTELDLEIGDVIRIQTGAYNKLHTVESITDNSSIIVNYEHAGNRGDGSLKLPDLAGQATVTRIAKWFNAPLGLGQKWVDTTPFRTKSTMYTGLLNRPIAVAVGHSGTAGAPSARLIVDGVTVARENDAGSSSDAQLYADVPATSEYGADLSASGSITVWSELR